VEDGECVQSLNHPNNYSDAAYCSITLYGDVSIVVGSFNTEQGYDILTINNTRYSGTRAPPSGVYNGVITWSSDNSISSSGWQLCKGVVPTPQPTPVPPPGNWFVTGTGCVEDEDGRCMSSLNHPSNYSNDDACEITLYGDVPISVEAFDTEQGYDILTVGDTQYSGTSGPPSGVYSGVITWTTDPSVSRSGWQLCKGAEPAPQPTPVLTPQPTPVPTPQPTSVPTPQPTSVPTPQPTPVPTPQPTSVPTPQPTSVPRIYCPRNECKGSGWVSKDDSCSPGESKGCWNVDDVYQCCDNYCENNECASGWVHHSVGCGTGQSIGCWNVDHLYHCCVTSG